eukprot:CAMPEP_0184481172 /NCGR_PEP_ID=MMETSP0113_2-20130426/2705_1 /TAXON_ID=91329 /ORGANISM="Norrisiella sphaerica, Strain BC52" /LENGTH=309 /DNA_ID=CAMNT_0026860111 /DNA_START=371 /DNA_END=1297 /DNA_ORIENTATION=-
MSLTKFYNLTSCVAKNCPRDEDAVIRKEQEEIEQDAECLATLTPIGADMNATTVNQLNCEAQLSKFTDQVHDTRDECPQELDVIWSEERNFLTYQHTAAQCVQMYTRLQKRVNEVISLKQVDEDEKEEEEEEAEGRERERQGETENCRNAMFTQDGEETPWMDSDGDTCAVYVRYVCTNPLKRPNRNIIQRGCVSGDCKGSGGLYANQACCACGGGDHSGSPYHPKNIVKRTKAIYSQRCMLASCIEKLGDCQMADGCVSGLSCVSNMTCPVGETVGSCRDTCASRVDPPLSETAKASLLSLMTCAGIQ